MDAYNWTHEIVHFWFTHTFLYINFNLKMALTLNSSLLFAVIEDDSSETPFYVFQAWTNE